VDIRALAEQLALNPLEPKDLLQTFGLIGVWAILFAETGLLVGFFFPGDSLLFLAGVAASPVADSIFGNGTRVSLAGLLIGAPICAILGAQLGHLLGARYGRRLFDRPDSRFFKSEYVEGKRRGRRTTRDVKWWYPRELRQDKRFSDRP